MADTKRFVTNVSRCVALCGEIDRKIGKTLDREMKAKIRAVLGHNFDCENG